ncbi:hypothetical protein B0H19DRAFT_1156221 [Mycena capillaripes]|nr:hypothetical protein B0H19DRAFT_1156221 [Mycena capillaripes]
MHHTPWTKKPSSGKGAIAEPPISKAIRHLESLKNRLVASSGNAQKDPKGGCFCQAREHSLPTYSALCRSCGLILCEVNLPQYASGGADCRDAHKGSASARACSRRGAPRRRGIPHPREPYLHTSLPSNGAPDAHSHVFELKDEESDGLVLQHALTLPSRPASRAESVEEEPIRVGMPPTEVPFAAAAKLDPLRPWKDLSGGSATYIPAPNLDGEDDGKGAGKRRRRNRVKAKESDESVAQGATAGSSGAGWT